MTQIKHETNQNASHTMGPWKRENRAICAPNGRAILDLEAIGGETEAEVKANASLIEAGPKLLAALVQVVAWAEPESGNFTSEEIEWLDEARIAIAEAKGRAA